MTRSTFCGSILNTVFTVLIKSLFDFRFPETDWGWTFIDTDQDMTSSSEI